MSDDEKDDFREIRKTDETKQNNLMKKMLIFCVGLLVATSAIWYFIEVYDWNKKVELVDLRFVQEQETVDIWMPEDPDRCEELIALSTNMINLNNGTKDISLWSENHQEVIIAIEEDYLKSCVPNENDMMVRVPSCTITYIEIQRLIDKMEEMQKDSLIESEQLEYDKLYQYYFGNYCNKVQDQIEMQPSFQEYNETRNE